MRKDICFLFFVYFFSTNISSQIKYKYQQFTIEDGLPTNAIYDIIEGKDGKMYIGTDNGLSVFDGIQFTNYNTKDGLYNPYIVNVERGMGDDIYCATYLGKLCKFSKHKITAYQMDINLGNTDELHILKDKFIYKNLSRGTSANTQLRYIEYYECNFNSKKINYLYNLGNKSQYPVAYHHNIKNYPHIFKYKNQSVFINDQTFYIKKRKYILPKGLPTIYKIELNEHFLFLISAKDLYIVTFDGNILDKITLPADITRGTNRCYTMVDAKGDLWLNIQLIGLYKLENRKWVIQNELLGFKKDESINKIYSDSKGRIWVCSYNNGLFLIPNIEAIYYTHPNLENRYTAFALLKDSSLYASARFSLLQILPNSLTHVLTRSNEFKFDKINDNYILLNTLLDKFNWGGLQTYVGKKALTHQGKVLIYGLGSTLQNYINYNHFIYVPNPKPKNTKIISLGDTLLCANTDSVYKATIWNDSFIRYHSALKLSISGFIYDMVLQGDTLVIAESNQIKYFYQNRLIKNILNINGVNLESIKKIERKYGKLWIYASNGVFYIDDMNQARVINKHNYLPSREVNDIMLYKSKYYFATNSGIASILSTVIEAKSSSPSIHLLHYHTDREYSITQKAIQLSPTDNYLKLNLNIQSSTNKENLMVQYSINNNIWVRSDLNEITLNNLASGSSSLQVRAKDVNSDWVTSNLEIYKAYPFYMRWWFILGTLGGLFYLGYLYNKKKIQDIRIQDNKELTYQTQIIELRQNALSALMNPHFIFNSLNAIQYYINSNQKEKSSEYLGKLSRLVRLFLNHASSSTILLSDELDRLEKYVELEKLRFYNFGFEVKFLSELDPTHISIPNMIIQPFIENAILHGISHLEDKSGNIEIHIQKSSTLLLIDIIDNGFGFNENHIKESSHLSKAISIIRERINLLNEKSNHQDFLITTSTPFPNQKRKGHKVEIQLEFPTI